MQEELRELLQVLKEFGVTTYESPELRLVISPTVVDPMALIEAEKKAKFLEKGAEPVTQDSPFDPFKDKVKGFKHDL